jgi:moderate conductance mechanosensitive channel
MNWTLTKQVFALSLLALLVSHGTVWAQKFTPPKAKGPSTAVTGEQALPQTPEQVDAYMGTLTDEQARKALGRTLKEKIASKGKEGEGSVKRGLDAGLGLKVVRLVDGFSALKQKLSGTVTSAEVESDDNLASVIERVTGGGGLPRFGLTLMLLGLVLGSGFVARWFISQATRNLSAWIMTSVKLGGRMEFLGRVIAHMFLQGLGLVVFAAVTFVLFVFLFQKGDPGYELAIVYLVITYYLLLFAFAARVLFAPEAPALRLFPMPENDARLVYHWTLILIVGAGLISGASIVLSELGVGRSAFLLALSLSGVYFVVALLALIWSCRKRVRDALLPEGTGASVSASLSVLARSWHLLASVYVVAMGLLWISDVLLGGDARVVDLALSLFVIPIAIGIDIWGQRLLKLATGELTEVVDLSGDEVRDIPPAGKGRDFKSFVPFIRRMFRLALVAFVFFVMLGLWGVELSVGRIFTSHVLSIAITLLLGFIVWEFVKARIDARLRLEMPSEGEDHDEGGGVGSRTGTLLLLLRKFILSVLFVIVSLIVLSSIGVNIGPLIAGAGVVGLAIGFGSQALVRDIIAGVFFLIDDSFRIGDYVESTGVKGMVEAISLRSIKLRHPRGMVYTIPFGNLKSITNFSRDYTITKLDFRVGFDTDLEQVRKVIKKINKSLRKDEEINKVMLDDLKSQGVKEFDDSSMIVRVKFKTLPGEQFKVRKEVYRMIQSEFRAAGIDFASRNVTVFVPPAKQDAAAATPEAEKAAILQAGAAAGLALIQKEEELKLQQAAVKKPGAL